MTTPTIHGWLALILPYIELGNLYNQINFKVNWDGAGNDSKTQSPTVPNQYQPAIFPVQKFWNDNQMCTAADRKELG